MLRVHCQAGIYARPGPPHHWQASNLQCGGLLSAYGLNEITYRCVQVITSHAMPLKRAHSNSGAINPPHLCNRITSHINRVTGQNGTFPRISSTISHCRKLAYSARSHMPGRLVFLHIQLPPVQDCGRIKNLQKCRINSLHIPPTEAAGLIGLIHS